MRGGWLGLLAAAALAATATARALAAPDELARARTAAAVLQRDWQVERNGKPDWRGINAWQRFEIVDALADYTVLSGDRRWLPLIERAEANRDGLEGNDDDLWTVISGLKLHAINGRPALLADGEALFGRIVGGYWDAHCGGGLWWDHARTYKNAITNELLAYAATLLYQATGKPAYLDWARRAWGWLDHSGMIGADGLVNDGLDAACRNNGGVTYTYNQGVILGALVNLYRIGGERRYLDRAVALAQASSARLAPHGVLAEPGGAVSQDGESFKGIYLRHLGYLYAAMPDGAARLALGRFLRAQADALHRRLADGRVDAYWDGPVTRYGAAAQASGLDAYDAAALGWREPARPGAR
jgi:predicted alpha-1,6-mannanase (GH76 family)